MISITPEAVLAALDDVKDPEIPVVSVVELGIVQRVTVDGDHVTVSITPTFTGCPALHVMREEIAERVRAMGAGSVDVPVVLDPPWSSDRIVPAARERMRAIGLAPPAPAGGGRRADVGLIEGRYRADAALALAPVDVDEPPACACPFCGSADTTMENPFGPTICRVLWYCNACQQPFEEFKAL